MSFAYHIDVAVSDYQKSLDFYDGLFRILGWELSFEKNRARSYSDGRFDYWIVAANPEEIKQGRGGLGFTHFAFRVEKPAEVDAVYKWLEENDFPIDIAPKMYPEYTPNYYAVFFFDPDGTRLEVISK